MPVDENELQRGHVHDIDPEGDDVEMRPQKFAFEHGSVHDKYLAVTDFRVSASFSFLTGFKI